MTNPFSRMVLGSAVLLSSPALYAAFVEVTMPMEAALMRFVVALAVAWVGTSLLEGLLTRTSAPARRDEPSIPKALPGVDGALPARPVGLDPDS